jgi:hypothetical protein
MVAPSKSWYLLLLKSISPERLKIRMGAAVATRSGHALSGKLEVWKAELE